MAMLSDYCTRSLYEVKGRLSKSKQSNIENGGDDKTDIKQNPKELAFELDEFLMNEINEANVAHKKLFQSLRVTARTFEGYGKGILKVYRYHPEAFIQVALQAAYVRLHGKPAPTYCTASTRKFAFGRTETCRSCTVESVEFAAALFDRSSSVSSEHRVTFFQGLKTIFYFDRMRK